MVASVENVAEEMRRFVATPILNEVFFEVVQRCFKAGSRIHFGGFG
jgi:hypothetical protein